MLQEGGAVRPALLPRAGQGRVEIPLGQGTNFRQPVPGKAHQGGAEDGQEGNILPGIVNDLEPGQGHGDLRGLEEVSPLLGRPPHPRLFQG